MTSTRTVTLQLSTQRDFLSWVIRWVTWSEFSHVDVLLEMPAERRLLGARFRGGVQARRLDYARFARVQCYTVTLTEEEYGRFLGFLVNQLGRPYDWRGILNFHFHRSRRWRDGRAWFCSELVAAAFECAGWPLLALAECDRVSPRDLTLSLKLKAVQTSAV